MRTLCKAIWQMQVYWLERFFLEACGLALGTKHLFVAFTGAVALRLIICAAPMLPLFHQSFQPKLLTKAIWATEMQTEINAFPLSCLFTTFLRSFTHFYNVFQCCWTHSINLHILLHLSLFCQHFTHRVGPDWFVSAAVKLDSWNCHITTATVFCCLFCQICSQITSAFNSTLLGAPGAV